MDDKEFEQIMGKWKQAEQKALNKFALRRSNACLSFEQFEKYAHGNFTEVERQHVSSCDYCQKMIKLFHQNAPLSIARLWVRWVQWIKQWRHDRPAEDRSIPEFLPFPHPTYNTLKLVLPILVITIMLSVLVFRNEKGVAPIAQIEPAPYLPLILRGNLKTTEEIKLFQEGMSFYSQQNYPQAIDKLSQAVKLDSTWAAGFFYLGVSQLLNNQPLLAIPSLQKAIALGDSFLIEKSYWYLGNTYLLVDQGSRARQAFEKVTEMGGDYAKPASQMLQRLE